MSKGKYLGIDFGEKRVGIAVSDFDKAIVFPRDYLEYKTLPSLIKSIGDLCAEEQIIKVVLGLPIEMGGTWGEKAKKVLAFGEKLKKALPSIAIEYFDERLTTLGASRMLRSHGIKAKEQRKGIDSVSAQIILQNYLNSL